MILGIFLLLARCCIWGSSAHTLGIHWVCTSVIVLTHKLARDHTQVGHANDSCTYQGLVLCPHMLTRGHTSQLWAPTTFNYRAWQALHFFVFWGVYTELAVGWWVHQVHGGTQTIELACASGRTARPCSTSGPLGFEFMSNLHSRCSVLLAFFLWWPFSFPAARTLLYCLTP